ncbi:hypothetical protein [Parasediminibacterium sp. JCM 36343]|uniref:hypothetical protein n=1 Tax=Parasediminibacterium sp. JCM 36343 TaxID=3374279 RepID=UPI0039780161
MENEIAIIEKKGSDAVKKLRLSELQSGHPFMINAKDLPQRECYLEYPEGFIELVKLNNASQDFTVVRRLSTQESDDVRLQYQLA